MSQKYKKKTFKLSAPKKECSDSLLHNQNQLERYFCEGMISITSLASDTEI